MKKNFYSVIFMIGVLLCYSGYGLAEQKSGMIEVYNKSKQMFADGEYKKVIELSREAIKRFPGSELQWLKVIYQSYLKLNRNDRALKTAIEIDSLSANQSSLSAMQIADGFLRLKDLGNAFKWFHIAADRGYKYYNIFETGNYESYPLLRGDSRIPGLIKKIKEKTGIGMPAKLFSAVALNGEKISLEKYRGKVVLIDFWATWCSYCIRGLGDLKRTYDEFKDKGFEILSVSLDSENQLKKLERFITDHNIEWPVIFSGDGWKDQFVKLYNVQMIPSYWLVDKKGVLREFGLDGGDLRRAISGLLKIGVPRAPEMPESKMGE